MDGLIIDIGNDGFNIGVKHNILGEQSAARKVSKVILSSLAIFSAAMVGMGSAGFFGSYATIGMSAFAYWWLMSGKAAAPHTAQKVKLSLMNAYAVLVGKKPVGEVVGETATESDREVYDKQLSDFEAVFDAISIGNTPFADVDTAEMFEMATSQKPNPSTRMIGELLEYFLGTFNMKQALVDKMFENTEFAGAFSEAISQTKIWADGKGKLGDSKSISSSYSERQIEEWKVLYESYGSFRRVHSHLKEASSNGKAPSVSTIAKYVKIWFTIKKLDYESWLVKYKKKARTKWKYTISDIKGWIKLYEKVGSFWGVCDIIEKKTGSRPDLTNVKTRIEEYFEENNKEFDAWADKFKKTAKKYKESEVESWISLYEEHGSFDYISNLLKQKNNGKGPDRSTIVRRVKNYFDSKKLDYFAWVDEYYNPNYEPVYSEADIKYWKILYERFGSFIDVSDYIKTKNLGVGPSRNIISIKLKEAFENNNEDYDKWINDHQKDNPSHFKESYTGEEVDNWEKLFESIGTFMGVSEYIREKNNGVGPYQEAIKRRLESKFISEGRDFDLWVQQYYNPNTLRSHEVGNFMHKSIKFLSARRSLKNDLDIFIETRVSKKTRHRVDYVVMKNDKFDKYITDKNKLFTIPQGIHQVGFDFTSSLKLSVIIGKCMKGYQGANKMLVIVVMSDKKSNFRLPKNIPNLQNVKIMNIFEYAELMGITVKNALEIYSLTKKAIHEDDAYNKLEALSNENNKKMIQLINKVKHNKAVSYNPFSDEAYKRYLQRNKLSFLLSQKSKDTTLDDFMK